MLTMTVSNPAKPKSSGSGFGRSMRCEYACHASPTVCTAAPNHRERERDACLASLDPGEESPCGRAKQTEHADVERKMNGRGGPHLTRET
jgi:hypothetical protein